MWSSSTCLPRVYVCTLVGWFDFLSFFEKGQWDVAANCLEYLAGVECLWQNRNVTSHEHKERRGSSQKAVSAPQTQLFWLGEHTVDIVAMSDLMTLYKLESAICKAPISDWSCPQHYSQSLSSFGARLLSNTTAMGLDLKGIIYNGGYKATTPLL